MAQTLSKPDPKRFEVARGTLRWDGFMNRFISLGGIAVILAVFGIFVFILLQILPLFGRASVERTAVRSLPVEEPLLLGADERGELPFVLAADGTFHFLDLATGGLTRLPVAGLPDEVNLTVADYDATRQVLLLGSHQGTVYRVEPGYEVQFGDQRRIEARPRLDSSFPGSGGPYPVLDLDESEQGEQRLSATIVAAPSGPEVHAQRFARTRSLFGSGRIELLSDTDLTPLFDGSPAQVLITGTADALLVRTTDGSVHFLERRTGEWARAQTFQPFPGGTVSLMEPLLGRGTIVFTEADGRNLAWTLAADPATGDRRFVASKSFPHLPAQSAYFSASQRNRAFLLGGESRISRGRSRVSLRYGTTEAVRWEDELPFMVTHTYLGKRYDRMFFLDTESNLHLYALDDPHPEAGLKAFFGQIWYEGQPEPAYLWQSTGGSVAFEPKLSLVNLIHGSLKGTFYALLFAVPIALLAAIYTSQFLQPSIRRIVKPTMEIMASLPSVVLGFLGALWLAPLIEGHIPSLLLVFLTVPLTAMLLGGAFTRLPIRYRLWLRPGWEWVAIVPVVLIVAWTSWSLGPVLENLLFVTGSGTADFRLWWPEATGVDFDQRNSVVVGFMMGFAVIPIIFTIAEDSLSNVPQSMVSGSLALGASRWQTAARIVLPTAFAGIFSALMIGLGRAVGETMIVVMATGNTPIMEFLNPFSGMRTLSANIAVELPEAPRESTLYRTLFLGAFVLFLLTFFINTLAEILRVRLRRRYADTG